MVAVFLDWNLFSLLTFVVIDLHLPSFLDTESHGGKKQVRQRKSRGEKPKKIFPAAAEGFPKSGRMAGELNIWRKIF